MIAAVVNAVGDGNGKALLNGFNFFRRFYRPNGSGRTGEKRLQRLPFLRFAFGLAIHRRLGSRTVKNGWSHPTASIAVDTSPIDVEVTARVFGSALFELGHCFLAGLNPV